MVVSGGVRGNTVDVLDIAKRLGASKVLAKPFTSEVLLAAVSELLPAAAV
jgi:CheY-like chemotaxis protein